VEWSRSAIALAALVLLVLFGLAVHRFRKAGFTIVEAAVILVVAALGLDWNLPLLPVGGGVVIGINVAGAVVPIVVSARILAQKRVRFLRALVVVAAVAALCWRLSLVVPGEGIVLTNVIWPVLLATVLGTAIVFARRTEAAPMAYVGGTLGALVGLDALRLPELVARTEGPAFYSIGGAGVSDAIFLMGLGAVLLDILLFGLVGKR